MAYYLCFTSDHLALMKTALAIQGTYSGLPHDDEAYYKMVCRVQKTAQYSLLIALCHTVQMAGVETIWELHTLTVMNLWYLTSYHVYYKTGDRRHLQNS